MTHDTTAPIPEQQIEVNVFAHGDVQGCGLLKSLAQRMPIFASATHPQQLRRVGQQQREGAQEQQARHTVPARHQSQQQGVHVYRAHKSSI